MKMFLFFSHQLNDAQKKDARENLGVTKFVALNKKDQEKFSNVDPGLKNVNLICSGLENAFLVGKAQKGDYALVQGDYGLTFQLCQVAFCWGLIPIYATTARVCKENADGTVTRTFSHCQFREYELLKLALKELLGKEEKK